MWANESVFYQIYPLGFCGAPKENDGKLVSRIHRVNDFLDHLERLGIGAVYFSPVFQSDRHGYDTRDYRVIDCRLGTNEDFSRVCAALHQRGIRVVLDGVFHHVGRGFWAFQDVLKNREQSPYKDWFFIDFHGNSSYNDGLWYEGWEGHYELVKLNLRNPQVVEHLFSCIRLWVEQFGIDGLRLDVAYCLDHDFLRQLRSFCDSLKEEFFLVGEVLFGDYNQIMNPQMLHSCTNYECYKGLHSSFNSKNLFELSHSLTRQFGPENWTLYKGKHLLCFVDNHDVTRAASILQERRNLPLLYAALFGMPGIPCLYYGSEWGIEGEKSQGDDALRPETPTPRWDELTGWIARLSEIHQREKALCFGGYAPAVLTNRQLVMERSFEGETVFVGINLDDQPYPFCLNRGQGTDLLTGEPVDLSAPMELPAFGAGFWKTMG